MHSFRNCGCLPVIGLVVFGRWSCGLGASSRSHVRADWGCARVLCAFPLLSALNSIWYWFHGWAAKEADRREKAEREVCGVTMCGGCRTWFQKWSEAPNSCNNIRLTYTSQKPTTTPEEPRTLPEETEKRHEASTLGVLGPLNWHFSQDWEGTNRVKIEKVLLSSSHFESPYCFRGAERREGLRGLVRRKRWLM